MGDSAAASYLRAAGHLPQLSDWLELRAAGATADAAIRRRRYSRITTAVAKARVAPSEAQARERWRDYAGAARAYAEMGENAQALRLRLMADPENASRAKIRTELFALLGGSPTSAEARVAIALADSSLGPLSDAEELVVARAANTAGMLARAATGFARVQRSGLDARDRYAYATVLSRLGHDADAAAEFARVPASAPLGGSAAYQRAISLLRAGKRADARAALRRIPQAFPRDTSAAAQSLFLTADLATDDGDDRVGRAGFLDLVKRYPASTLASSAAFHAGVIAYAAGSFDAAARDFESLLAKYPTSLDATAARYWAGRSRDRAGDRNRAASHWRDVIATDPLSYYAMRSASRLGTTAWRPVQTTDSLPSTPALERAVERAALLEALGMNVEEWIAGFYASSRHAARIV
jgi:TolA-binding protein